MGLGLGGVGSWDSMCPHGLGGVGSWESMCPHTCGVHLGWCSVCVWGGGGSWVRPAAHLCRTCNLTLHPPPMRCSGFLLGGERDPKPLNLRLAAYLGRTRRARARAASLPAGQLDPTRQGGMTHPCYCSGGAQAVAWQQQQGRPAQAVTRAA